MAGHLLFNSGSNESILAPQFKWLDNTFKQEIYDCSCKERFKGTVSQDWVKADEGFWSRTFVKGCPAHFLTLTLCIGRMYRNVVLNSL